MKKYLLAIALWLVSLLCRAGFNEGVTAYEKGDYPEALKAWKAIAEQKPTVTGDFEWHSTQSKNTVEAQYGLALLYWQGKGVAQNYQEAEKWLILAANSGHSEAQLKLAYLYLEGLSGKANITEASQWFEKSAQQGNVNAQYNLGLLYWRGLGVMQNPPTAKKWLTAAASQGDTSAKELLAEIKTSPVQTAASKPIEAPKPLPAIVTPPSQPNTLQTAEVPTPVAENLLLPAVTSPTVAPTPEPQPIANSNAPQLADAPSPASLPATIVPAVANTDATVMPPSPPLNDYYAVQLIGSPKQNDVLQFMESWRSTLNPLVMTDKIKKSERIFIVVYGSYASTTEAKQAIANLPPELKKSRPWVVKMHGNALAL